MAPVTSRQTYTCLIIDYVTRIAGHRVPAGARLPAEHAPRRGVLPTQGRGPQQDSHRRLPG